MLNTRLQASLLDSDSSAEILIPASASYTGMKLAGSFHCPISSWNVRLLSTSIWPSLAMRDRVALQRPRGRAFEVDAVLVKPAAVAGAFEFLLRFEPVRRAAQVRADALEREDLLLAVVFGVDDPHAELRLESLFDLPGRKLVGRADLEPARRLAKNVREHEPHRCPASKRRPSPRAP